MPTPPDSPPPRETPLVDRLRASTAGRYEIHAELGAGGMATVFRATEIALEREVAIKVMSMAAASTPDAFERFRREARMAAALSHPHIVPIYAIGEDPSLAYFAMKFIEGRGLDQILRAEGAQPIQSVARTIGVVGQALNYAHERGVVHRDVKPANIMVGNDGWTFVTDFGIAKRDDAQALTQAGTVIGTPAYMSPEQFNGQAITGAADQYSLGIVAFELLTGRAPFDGPSLGEVMRGHLLDPVPPIRTLRLDVPVGVADVVTRMLEKDPAKRFPTLGDAATALEAAASVAKGALRRPRFVARATPTSSPTTPIPRPSSTASTTGPRRPPTTAARALPSTTPAKSRSLVPFLLVVLVIAGGSWLAVSGRLESLLSSASLPAAALATAPAAMLDSIGPVAAADSAPADTNASAASTPTTTATSGSRGGAMDTAPKVASLESEIAMFAARVASAPVVDLVPLADSAVVRLGSQTAQTVLFVNGEQLGIVGGRGLISTTVVPGPVALSIRKIGCRDWDTTFTTLAGRRYTFAERSPSC